MTLTNYEINQDEKSISQKVLSLATPIVSNQLIRLLTTFIATLIVARLGPLPLAGMGLAYTFNLTLMLFTMGMGFGSGILVGNYFGANEHEKITLTTVNAVWLGIFLSIPVLLLLALSEPIFLFFHQDSEISTLASHYLHAIGWGVPAMILFFNLQQTVSGIGRPFILNVIAIFSMGCNITLYYLLVLGHFGFPKLGLPGVGYSFSITIWFNLLILIAYIQTSKYSKSYRILQNLHRLDSETLKMLGKIGVLVGINMTLDVLSALIFVILVGVIDHESLAAYQIVQQLQFIPVMFPVGISQAGMIVVSQCIGAGKFHELRACARLTTIMTLVSLFVFSLCYWLFPQTLIQLFMGSTAQSEPHIVQTAVELLVIMACFQFGDGVRLNSIGILRGLRDLKAPMLISIIWFYVIGAPLAFVAAFLLHWGVVKIWALLGLTTIAAGVHVYLRMQHKIKEETANRC